jgi:hypothetical protein
MKKILSIAGLTAILIPAATFAAGISLNNGGVGQVASNPSQFGISVCNNGSAAVTQSVPVSVSVNGQTATVQSAAPIAGGACAYAYLDYSQFGMQAGNTYSASVTIDPQKTAITNSDNQASYSVAVPGAGAQGTAGTADVNAQSGNFFTMIFNWFAGLFGGK